MARTAGLVANIDRGFLPAARAFDGAGDAAQRIEVMVNGGDAQFDRFKVLIGQINVFQRLLQQGRVLDRLAVQPIGKGFARLVGVGQFILIAKGR